jgi:hypothetical protein
MVDRPDIAGLNDISLLHSELHNVVHDIGNAIRQGQTREEVEKLFVSIEKKLQEMVKRLMELRNIL